MQSHDTSSRQADIAALARRLYKHGVHRASQAGRLATCSTGWPALDRILPGRGYPLTGVTEWLIEQTGIGEFGFLLQAMAPRLAAAPQTRLVLINPPHHLNALALEAHGIDRARLPIIRCERAGECVWSVEQLAEAGGLVGLVLWEQQLDSAALRRLQLASEKAGCPVFVYRALAAARQRSPAALRLALTSRQGRQRLEVIKCRGPAGARMDGLTVDRDTPWHAPPPITGLARVATTPADNDVEPPAVPSSHDRSRRHAGFRADRDDPPE
ncbi:translesion DNA synthesis-associated protein ImuA [Salinisphaera sp. Q1T1-3]|uniref:translesion DNA synthesis-associated protein ImuA n=1 Tax=Salinisphaera sp. Q1T1-3 TaxID=2321229 RepID=UPI000E72B59F|nr:translesion DNA synthesis-associated protein ImuA [Salinisphaera sp. Q1T1-3]RJS95077.1 translesion DNA synthesis-associated protein ImuA [Salinisphaera sp. Q1T1-3]